MGAAASRGRGRSRAGAGRSGGAPPEPTRGVYMISVAAELAGMHPQTLRIYEARGLVSPQRSPKNTRLYSQRDVERLRRIQQLTSELGMNLAGVERVFELEEELDRMRERLTRLERSADELKDEMEREMARLQRSLRAELVPYEPPGRALTPKRVQVPIERRARGR